ncbi:hypothetical protein CW751_02560 [Brumimicrobium salinarum]|uniref:Rhodanese domain-containing protein n=1 Tax=Brumimicrobium salinarum TaxID=2058658 RepID=A0A2I0R6L9_9FLAO|nr:rhodanese-like domain-containing protein [Brumimicrobium salinarum]PKR82233.1 hypothetical protein CW751_02560 [Brumimicrobium salinarum]
MKIITLLTLSFLFATTALWGQEKFEGEKRFESVGNDEFREALETGDYILLDTRTVKEYEERHIEGAKLVLYNDGDMDADLKNMPKDRKYLVYCAVGVRSKVAMNRMKELGFNYVLELDKGIKEWK